MHRSSRPAGWEWGQGLADVLSRWQRKGRLGRTWMALGPGVRGREEHMDGRLGVRSWTCAFCFSEYHYMLRMRTQENGAGSAFHLCSKCTGDVLQLTAGSPDNLQSWGRGSRFVQEWLNAWCKFRDMLATHRGGQEVDVISVWRGRGGFLEVVAVR